jgi:hypothetical protein
MCGIRRHNSWLRAPHNVKTDTRARCVELGAGDFGIATLRSAVQFVPFHLLLARWDHYFLVY